MQPKYPGVEVQMSGEDGNAMSIIVRVGVALRRGLPRSEGYAAEKEWKAAAFATKSYDELLQLAMKWVETR